jgi:MFS family permease
MNRTPTPTLFYRGYYGWIIVLVALVSMAFWIGIRTSFSVFYVALLEEFPWNRGDSAGAQSLALVTYTVLAPLVGWLIDKFGPRRVMVPGILVLVMGLVLCAFIKTLTQFYIFYGVVMGSGITCIGIISYSAILAHWFQKKRGLASGIAVSGMGLGTFLFVPLTQFFIHAAGWRTTFMITAGLVLFLVLPLNWVFLKHKPQEIDQQVDGSDSRAFQISRDEETDGAVNNPNDSFRYVIRTFSFWSLMAFPFLVVIGIYITLVHNVQFMVDQGISKMTAAWIFAMVGIISSVFRIFWGWLSDRWGREKTFTLGVLCACLGVGSLILLEATGARMYIYSFLMLFGMGWGVTAPMFMAVSADLFKGRAFGFIYGLVEAGIGFGGALGAWIAGLIFDHTSSYQWAFFLAISGMLCSCFFVWMAAPRKVKL